MHIAFQFCAELKMTSFIPQKRLSGIIYTLTLSSEPSSPVYISRLIRWILESYSPKTSSLDIYILDELGNSGKVIEWIYKWT